MSHAFMKHSDGYMRRSGILATNPLRFCAVHQGVNNE